MRDAGRLIRWAAAGGGSLLLQLVFQGALISAAQLPDRLAIVLSYELALLAHFFMNHWWVFGERGRIARKLAEYHVASLTAELVTFAAAFLVLESPLARTLGPTLAPYAATILGTGAAMVVTYTSNFMWIWRPQPAPAVAAAPVTVTSR
jgi:putative flippase GtrA